MRLEWIEDILAVLETGSFAAAAERRYLTASAFTRRIRGIEETLGCQLFDRSHKPVTLLPHVRNLELELRDTARQLRELQLGLADIGGHRQKRLSMGCQHALSAMVSPRLASSLRRDHDIEMRIRSGTRSECHHMLVRQEVDFGLIYETPGDALQFDSRLFEKINLGNDALLPVGNLHDNIGIRRAVEAQKIPLITYPPTIYLGEILRIHILPEVSQNIETHSVAETGLTLAVLQFIRQGIGVGWLPKSVAQESLERGELTDLSNVLPSAQLSIHVVRARTGSSDTATDAWAWLLHEARNINIDGISPPAPE